MSKSASIAAIIFLACGVNTTPPPVPTQPAPAAGPRIVFPDNFVVHVEVAAGVAAKHQVKNGDTLKFERLDNVKPR